MVTRLSLILESLLVNKDISDKFVVSLKFKASFSQSCSLILKNEFSLLRRMYEGSTNLTRGRSSAAYTSSCLAYSAARFYYISINYPDSKMLSDFNYTISFFSDSKCLIF